MRFPPEFLDELRLRLPIAELVGRKVKLTRRGREHVGLCPFHNEKTPSFTVSDEKGFYHCFGCGAHGDIIRFAMETEQLSFPETVERLADAAGLQVPQLSPAEAARYQRSLGLYDLMEAAAKWFQSRLSAGQGEAARGYVAERGLSEKTIGHFGLGFAPRSRTALKEAMLARKFSEDQLVEGGLVIRPEDNPTQTYDRFRNRIMFPILDTRGRVVAFGGRAMGDAGAKYLNSPETPLFHKGRMLYNFSGARKPAIEKSELVVAEGYMDVIALHQAGFANAVAPLGTALTEDQLALLWRLAPEPVLCFDGDKAGVAAAGRAMERALPLLKPGHSLRFALMPEGEDPDSLVKREGPGAFTAVFEGAAQLSEMLWRKLTDSVDISTPERRAGLEKEVFDSLKAMRDEKVRAFYQREFKDRLFKAFRPSQARLSPRFTGQGRRATGRVGRPGSGLTRTALGRRRDNRPVRGPMEELLVLAILNYPQLLIAHQEDFAALNLESNDLDALRREILDGLDSINPLDCDTVRNHLVERGHERLYTRLTDSDARKSDWSARPGAALEDAEKSWVQTLKRYRRITDLEQELKVLEADLKENTTDEGYARMLALQKEINANSGDEADIEGYGLASERGMTY